ncbi:MAG: phtH [Gammaproteobacteria bacterium]|nr:phtH [Gammaproteobacteria bacterium]
MPAKFLPFVIYLLAASFYLYEFMLQIAPGVMTFELMRDFNIQAAGLGVISAFFYYAYTPMQLPAGLLYDRFGPRTLITLASLICASGALVFALTKITYMAAAGRFLMGMGSAFAFIGILIIVANWFSPGYFAFFAGITQLMGSVGAIVGETPLALAVARFGWQATLLIVAGIGFILALAIWLIVRDSPPGKPALHANSTKGIGTTLKEVLGKRQTWAIATYSFTIWAPITVFAALWGVPYLMVRFNISAAMAASAVTMIWIGVGIGSPFVGWFSDKIGRRNLPLVLCAILGIFSTSAILYIVHLNLIVIYGLLFLFGFAAGGQSLIFGVVKDINPPGIVGTAIGFNNMCVVAGGALFQPFVGYILHKVWHGELQNGVPVYLAQDYQRALLLLPLCFLIAWLIGWLGLRETYCKPHY